MKSYGNHNYTGAYADTHHGFFRGGFIAEPENDGIFKIGFALKILRSKVQSANTVAFWDPTGQKEFDFFTHEMSNHVHTPSDLILKVLSRKFKQASNCINMVGLREFATYDIDGNEINTPVYPFKT